MQKITADISLTFPMGGHIEGNYSRLTITDRSSGMRIFEADLTAEAFAGLMATRPARVEAEVIDSDIFDRVGKKYEHIKLDVPEPLNRESVLIEGKRTPKLSVLDWAEENKPAADGGPEWQGPSMYMHNYGWAATWVRWV